MGLFSKRKASSDAVKVQVREELPKQNFEVERENLQREMAKVNALRAQLESQARQLQQERAELAKERERLDLDRERLDRDRAELREEGMGWGVNRDRNSLVSSMRQGREVERKRTFTHSGHLSVEAQAAPERSRRFGRRMSNNPTSEGSNSSGSGRVSRRRGSLQMAADFLGFGRKAESAPTLSPSLAR